jgi:hypothetical protein
MIKIWKFRDAPQHLKQLQPAGEELEWVMSVPASLRAEVDVLLLAAEQRGEIIFRQELEDGALVFFGRSANPTLDPPAENDPARKQRS